MSSADRDGADLPDAAPGEERAFESDLARGFRGYAVGLALAALLTAGSFWLPTTNRVWGPALPVALAVFTVAHTTRSRSPSGRSSSSWCSAAPSGSCRTSSTTCQPSIGRSKAISRTAVVRLHSGSPPR